MKIEKGSEKVLEHFFREFWPWRAYQPRRRVDKRNDASTKSPLTALLPPYLLVSRRRRECSWWAVIQSGHAANIRARGRTYVNTMGRENSLKHALAQISSDKVK